MKLLLNSNEDELAKRIDVQKACAVEAAQAASYSHLHNPANLDPWNTGSFAFGGGSVRGA